MERSPPGHVQLQNSNRGGDVNAAARHPLLRAIGNELPRWALMQLVCVAAWLLDAATAAAGIERSFWRFLVFNVLYTFGHVYLRTRRVQSVAEAAFVGASNCVLYATAHLLKHLLASHWLVWLYVPLFCFALVPLEKKHFDLFNDPRTSDERYVIRKSTNPADNLLTLAIAIMVVVGSYALDCSSSAFSSGAVLFLPFVVRSVLVDILFGVAHNLAHRVPWLWAKHKIHHEYRSNELNTHANFYSDFVDGLSMTYSIAVITIFDRLAGLPVWALVDHTCLGVFSHHKYSKLYIGQFMAYEIDILFDVILGHKLADFHHVHHRDLSRHFTVLGIVADRTVSALTDYVLPLFHPSNKDTTGIDGSD